MTKDEAVNQLTNKMFETISNSQEDKQHFCEGIAFGIEIGIKAINQLDEPYLHTEELLQKMLTINANNLGSTDARERGAYEIKKAFAEFNGEPCDREMWECGLIKCDHRCGFEEK